MKCKHCFEKEFDNDSDFQRHMRTYHPVNLDTNMQIDETPN